MLMQSVDILEETNVTELVQLVVSDGLYSHVFAEVIQVRLGCSNCCDTGTREAYLGGRSKFINNVRISCFRTLIKDLKKEILIVIIEMVDAVSVIPVNTEVRCCRFQMCETFNGFFGISVTLRVGVFRNTPDSLYCRVFIDVFLNHIHIRAFRRHRNVDHLNTEEFCDTEVTVISRYRTEEFYLIKLAPWCIPHNSMGIGTCNGIEHYIQTGVTINNDILRLHLRHLTEKSLGFRNSIDNAIVTAVHAGLAFQVCIARKYFHHFHGKIKLIRCRFTTGHVQCQTFCLDLIELTVEFFL